MKKKIGTIICFMLLLSITTSVVSGQVIEEENKFIKLKSKNTPPNNPIISAPDEVIKNRVFILKFISTDPDGDKIFYRIKMGEAGTPSNWIGPFESGFEEKLRVRIMFYTGDLIFGVQAKDEHGATSDWSYHTITYLNTRSQNIFGNTFLCFLQKLLQIIR